MSAMTGAQELERQAAGRVPTVAAAAAAAEAIARQVPGVRRICLFGSVALGKAKPDSDIDLLAVFDDIDYAERKQAASRCLAAATAAPGWEGHRISIVATDTAEWEIRSNLLTSFERAISTDLVELHQSKVPINHRKGAKPMTDKPYSDLDEAYSLIRSARIAYDRAIDSFSPKQREIRSQQEDHSDDHLSWHRYDRYVSIITQIDMVLETSLKAFHHLLGKTPPPLTHRLEILLNGLPSTTETSLVAQTLSELRVDRLPSDKYNDHDLSEVYTNWRVHGTYDSMGIAPEYLPTERLEAYLDAADKITGILIQSLKDRTPGGLLKDTPEVALYLEVVQEMRQLRSNYDLETGHRL